MAGERTRTVAVRLSPAEHEVWLAAAAAAERGRLGSWVRDQVAGSLALQQASTSAAAGAAAAGAAAGADVGAGAGVGVDLDPGPGAGGALGSGVGSGVLPGAGLRAQVARVGNVLNQAVRFAYVAGVSDPVAERLIVAVDRAREVLGVVSRQLAGRG